MYYNMTSGQIDRLLENLLTAYSKARDMRAEDDMQTLISFYKKLQGLRAGNDVDPRDVIILKPLLKRYSCK